MNYRENSGTIQTYPRAPSNIISRREIEPMLLKAFEVMKTYVAATDTAVTVVDNTGQVVADTHGGGMSNFCLCCKQYHPPRSPDEGEAEGYPCAAMHTHGIGEAQRAGGSYIYMCNLGRMFWVSPLFSNGRSVGTLIARGILGITQAEAAAKLARLSGGAIPQAEAEEYAAEYPERDYEDIKALAQILLFCAEQISRGTEDFHETLAQRGESASPSTPPPHAAPQNHAPETAVPFRYPLDKERALFAALRRGDSDMGRKILKSLLEDLFALNPHNLTFIQLRAIELVVLLSREAACPDTLTDINILEANNRYLQRLQEAKNLDELTDILNLIVDRMASQIFSFHGVRHASALRKAERFIWENYTRRITLQEVAHASGLSGPYFCSIFKEEMGENLSSYLNRLRIEKAAVLLTESDLSLSEIAGTCGFEDQSWFCKTFKTYIGVNPGKYRDQGVMRLSFDGEVDKKNKEIS